MHTFPELPDKLRLVDGELVCADGSDVREYLREWAKKVELTQDDSVVLFRRDGAERLRAYAFIGANFGA